MEKENEKLRKKLNQFYNSNTPTSHIPAYLKQYSTTREPGKKKKGRRKKRHVNIRTPPEKFDKKVTASANCCPNCSGQSIDVEDKHEFTIYELPKITLMKIKAVVLHYGCKDCGIKFEGKHPQVPIKGQIGPGLQCFFAVLKHHFGGAYGKISEFTEELMDEKFCRQTINNSISNIAEMLNPSYNKIKEDVKKSKVKQCDETGWPVNGKNWWLWVVVAANFVYLSIEKSRSSQILKKIFGVAEDFVGVLVSDCYSAYQAFKVVSQKCWLHLLRKAKFEAKKHPKKDVHLLYQSLISIYDSINDFLRKKPNQSQRILHTLMYKQKLDRICLTEWKSKEAITLVNRIKKYIHQWLVGVIITQVPLHNNDNERPIRSLALPRKVCGGHRTEKGARDFSIIASHLQSWRLRKLPQFSSLSDFLSSIYAGKNPSL
ncbi:MAG: IS66 family transposase [Nanoarchaeota archaeon]|nr:IS66 family transposase [Nanoarchaeota archaeon]